MKYHTSFDHWTIIYSSGAKRFVKTHEAAKSEALSNPNVVGIRPPLFGDA